MSPDLRAEIKRRSELSESERILSKLAVRVRKMEMPWLLAVGSFSTTARETVFIFREYHLSEISQIQRSFQGKGLSSTGR